MNKDIHNLTNDEKQLTPMPVQTIKYNTSGGSGQSLMKVNTRHEYSFSQLEDLSKDQITHTRDESDN